MLGEILAALLIITLCFWCIKAIIVGSFKVALAIGVAAVVLSLLNGCATVYPECEGYDGELFAECQQDESTRRDQIDLENWLMCAEAYRQSHVAVTLYVQGPYNSHREDHEQPNHIIRDLLRINNCRMILNPHDLWVDY